MRNRDLPDSHLASCLPSDDTSDTPRDFLREAFAADTGPLTFADRATLRARDFRLIDEALALITGEFPKGSSLAAFGAKASAPDAQDVVIRFLAVLRYARDSRLRLDALCFLRILGDEGRSFEEIGVEAGLGPDKKGTVHKRYREIQGLLGELPGRGDKSPSARQKYRDLRIGQRRPRLPWSGAAAWSQPMAVAA